MSKRPKMILFDYGHTLVHEIEISQLKGQRAIMPYIKRNDSHHTAEDIAKAADELFFHLKQARNLDFELHNHMFQRYLYESLGIELSISIGEAENIFWDHFAPGEAMPHAAELLAYLREQKIRTGIISNISFSGDALKKRLQRIYPEHSFEMIIASSEYLFRKPDNRIFQLATTKAELPAKEIWYCGDSPLFDIEGAAAAGMVPVWYCSKKVCHYREHNIEEYPSCAHREISDWQELISLFKRGDPHEE